MIYFFHHLGFIGDPVSLLQFLARNEIIGPSKKGTHLKAFHKGIIIGQLAPMLVVSIAAIQIRATSGYSPSLLTWVAALSYSLGICQMAFLAMRFFSWYATNKNLVVLLYAISALSIIADLAFGIASVAMEMASQHGTIGPHLSYITPYVALSPISDFIDTSYLVFFTTSFLLTWAATTMLLRYHFRGMNKSLYWPVVVGPLAYFMIQFQPALTTNLGLESLGPTLFGIVTTLLTSWSRPIGGILFGLAFFLVARKIGNKDVLKTFALVAGSGYMILFASNQVGSIGPTSYPPFGLASISFVGLACSLVVVGIYSSAISMSEDINFRSRIRRTVQKESNLLDSVGAAEREKVLYQRVSRIAAEEAKQMSDDSGVKFLNDDEIKGYLDEVMKELQARAPKQ